jgi:hypothetical protein
LRNACYADNADVLKILLEKGFDPNDQENGGSTLINILLNNMTWSFGKPKEKTGIRLNELNRCRLLDQGANILYNTKLDSCIPSGKKPLETGFQKTDRKKRIGSEN